MTHGTVALISGLFDLSGGIFVFIKMIYDSSLGVRWVFTDRFRLTLNQRALFQHSFENHFQSYADISRIHNIYITVMDKKFDVHTNDCSGQAFLI